MRGGRPRPPRSPHDLAHGDIRQARNPTACCGLIAIGVAAGQGGPYSGRSDPRKTRVLLDNCRYYRYLNHRSVVLS
jgi:hypothetical protein